MSARMFNAEKIGNNIKKGRVELGLTQKQLALRAEVSLSSIKKYENGERIPEVMSALLISDALNTSIENLFEWER